MAEPTIKYPEKLVIGTRGSPLAMRQTETVRDLLAKKSQNTEFVIKKITTSGDWRPEDGERRLDAMRGGKALFAKEIEEALLVRAVDIAVHSMKDMEATLPKGLKVGYMLAREDVRDVFLSDNVQKFFHLPKGATIGTTSIRRQAIALKHRPDLNFVPFRGNVETRIAKLRAGQVDATFLAAAGLNRMGLAHEGASFVETDFMLPAVGQGAVGIEYREEDEEGMAFLSQISCDETYWAVKCERAVMRALGGSCFTPVGIYARFQKDRSLRLDVSVFAPDGQSEWRGGDRQHVKTLEEAIAMGVRVGEDLHRVVPSEVLEI